MFVLFKYGTSMFPQGKCVVRLSLCFSRRKVSYFMGFSFETVTVINPRTCGESVNNSGFFFWCVCVGGGGGLKSVLASHK